MDTESSHDSSVALARGLGGYIRAVAAAIGLPAEGTSFEISDTATGYLGLTARGPAHPDHDLMLNWSERLGWWIAVETAPNERQQVLAQFVDELLPAPVEVAAFVANTLSGTEPASEAVESFHPVDRTTLAHRLEKYAAS
ncbi:hypothetical protein FHU38_001293 [Saccharomonospora amisosensis]|uniref:DUF6292 domain-containing protein n=1 Tax=Saccharomonospora amisosensis TaxID=1128677 RepID=A0A7X5UNL8_9PSEU|nr:DUF6292 family protein [Saccharomonospora amisosensis]NIJ10949.1 hypothetical protein [Saccharomonospora amisosensis]